MKPFPRAERVSEHLHRTLSALMRKQIKDPRLASATITGVKMSADLKSAIVYYVASGPEEARKQVASGFESARGFVKRTLARHLGLRYMPDIKFFYDESIDYGQRIDEILQTIKSEHGPDH